MDGVFNMKRMLGIVLIAMFVILPLVVAQDDINTFSYNIESRVSAEEVVPTSLQGDVLHLNITFPEEASIYVNIYVGESCLPSSLVYGNNSIWGGAFAVNVTLVGGLHTIYIFNDMDYYIMVNGFWTLNYTNGNITTITGTNTTATGNTTWTGNGPPPIMPDYLGIFLDVMVRWVAPALIALIVIMFIYRKCRTEGLDYLTIFEDREMLSQEDDDDGI